MPQTLMNKGFHNCRLFREVQCSRDACRERAFLEAESSRPGGGSFSLTGEARFLSPPLGHVSYSAPEICVLVYYEASTWWERGRENRFDDLNNSLYVAWKQNHQLNYERQFYKYFEFLFSHSAAKMPPDVSGLNILCNKWYCRRFCATVPAGG